MRILIAGDDATSMARLEAVARELGHDVLGSTAPSSVLPSVMRAQPDVVVLDVGSTSQELEALIGRLHEAQRTAVVLAVESRELVTAAALARSGVGAVVAKPVRAADLAVAVEIASARFNDVRDLRRQSEEAQRERVRLLQVFAASADGIYIARHDGTLSMINDAAIRMLGMNLRDLRGRRLGDWTADFKTRTGDGRELGPSELPLSRALAGEVVASFEVWLDALDGQTRCLRMSAAPVVNAEGSTVEAVAVMRDVTIERTREQDVGRRSEQRRRELTQLSLELLGAQSPEELARRCVARVREALGASRVRMVTVGRDGKTRVLSGEVGRPLPTRGTTMQPGGLGLLGFVVFRGLTVRSDDLWLEERFSPDDSEANDRAVVAAPLALGDRTLGVLACASDQVAFFDDDDAQLVTLMANQAAMALENLRLADQIAAEQKMAALGVMAAGIVHEIKNPLSYVQANVESAEELLEKLSEAAQAGQLGMERLDPTTGIDAARIEEDRQALAEARAGCARLFKIIDDIKTYAHPGQARRDWADINRLVNVSLTLAGSELRRSCRVQKSFARLPEVLCDGAKISQVVLNLLVNAAQAIEKDAKAGGRVGQIDVSTRLVDGAVRIVVKDDGPGMSPEVQKKIFLPFFTTKPAGVGTGLGLAISRRLMESQGGTIEVESEPGKGAAFTIVLPIQSPEDKQG